jgi:iron complex transport system substrate-binding protein
MTRKRAAWRSRRGWSLLSTAALLLVSTGAQAVPARVASIWLCADVLLVRLADRSRIVSLTRFAANPALSPVARIARDIPANQGRAEDILPARPDLVLAGTNATPTTRALLRRLGTRVVALPVATNFAGIRANIRTVAAALGARERGEGMIAAMDRRLAAVRAASGPRPRVLFYRGGYVQGRGTLLDAMMAAAGLENHGTAIIGDGVGWVSLERLLLQAPDALLLGGRDPRRDRRATGPANHPALRQLIARLPSLPVSDSIWHCGWPDAVAGVERMARFRMALRAGKRP